MRKKQKDTNICLMYLIKELDVLPLLFPVIITVCTYILLAQWSVAPTRAAFHVACD